MFDQADISTQALLSSLGATMNQDASEWTVPIEQLEAVVDSLAALNYTFRVEYDSPPIGEEGAEERAAHLPLLEEGGGINIGPQLIYVEDDPNPHGNQELMDLLVPLASDVQWEPGWRPGWFRVSSAPRLPEPIQIRTLFDKWEGETGLWTLSHDGRKFFTRRNLATLLGYGVAVVDDYQYRTEKFTTLPTLAYSGRVINALMDHGLQLDGSPSYFLLED